MLSLLWIDAWTLVYLFIVSWYSTQSRFTLRSLRKYRLYAKDFSLSSLLILAAIFLALLSFLTHTSDLSFVMAYFVFSFSLLLFLHLLLVFQPKQLATLLFLIFTSIIFFFLVTHSRNSFLHNFFVILSTVWLSNFVRSWHKLSIRVFLVISILWFFYDVLYVWIFRLYQPILQTSYEIGFPLGIISQTSSLGLADLFWAAIFLQFLPTLKLRYIFSFVFVFLDFILGVLFLTSSDPVFLPLLVVWIPFGFLFLFLMKLFQSGK
jgi:hypothetical protein